MHPTHGTTSIPAVTRAAVLALTLVLGLGAAVPAAAAERRAESERPTWVAPWTHLGELLGRLFGGEPVREAIGRSETDGGPDMDPDGAGAEGDGGPDMDPDGLGAESDGGPDMDPDG